MATIRLALHAMATRFELVLHGADSVRLRAAGEMALAEISRLEAQLSFYRPASDVNRINTRAAHEPVQVEPRLFEVLQTAQRLYRETEGAFDVTIGPLMRCWGFVNHTGHLPKPEALEEARSRTGMHLVHLGAATRTVRFEKPGVAIDLGGIGKGYAIDEAMTVLREVEVTSALLHGGTSTIYAMGRPPGEKPWKTALPTPGAEHDPTGEDDVLAVITLEDEALSVSAVSGKSFYADGVEYGHVLDARSGRPVEGAALAAVIGPSAIQTDALSTALLVEGLTATESMAKHFGVRTLTASPPSPSGHVDVQQYGIPLFRPSNPTLAI